MAYTKEQINEIFNTICKRIEEGESLRSVLRSEKMPEAHTFYKWVDSSEEKLQQYARVAEVRAEKIFEDIICIADDQEEDVYTNSEGVEVTNHNVINRARLRVDARKWMLSKMMPTKYGDKLEVEQKQKQSIEFINVSKQFPDK